MQPHKVAFEDQPHLTSDMNVGTFITKSGKWLDHDGLILIYL